MKSNSCWAEVKRTRQNGEDDRVGLYNRTRKNLTYSAQNPIGGMGVLVGPVRLDRAFSHLSKSIPPVRDIIHLTIFIGSKSGSGETK
jgi:hypothetical protein